jgi:ABC-2 type transport system permease protein
MTALLNHFAFEFKTGLRNPTLMLMNYLFPLAFYALMGLVMTQINPGFKETLTPAIVIFAILVSTLLGLPAPLVESRDAGIYRSYKINGVPALAILAIPTLTTIFHALIVSAVIALTATPLFGAAPPVDAASFALITLLMAFTCGALGSLIGVIASGSRSTVLWSQLIFLPSMLIGGLMMPLSLLPTSVRSVSGLLPTTHAMQAYAGLAYNQDTLIDPLAAAAILLSAGILAFGLAIYLFNWDSHNRTRRGQPWLALLAAAPFAVGMFLLA